MLGELPSRTDNLKVGKNDEKSKDEWETENLRGPPEFTLEHHFPVRSCPGDLGLLTLRSGCRFGRVSKAWSGGCRSVYIENASLTISRLGKRRPRLTSEENLCSKTLRYLGNLRPIILGQSNLLTLDDHDARTRKRW